MTARTLALLTAASGAATALHLYPFSSLIGLLITLALGLTAYRAIDAEFTQQYTGNTTPGAKP